MKYDHKHKNPPEGKKSFWFELPESVHGSSETKHNKQLDVIRRTKTLIILVMNQSIRSEVLDFFLVISKYISACRPTHFGVLRKTHFFRIKMKFINFSLWIFLIVYVPVTFKHVNSATNQFKCRLQSIDSTAKKWSRSRTTYWAIYDRIRIRFSNDSFQECSLTQYATMFIRVHRFFEALWVFRLEMSFGMPKQKSKRFKKNWSWYEETDSICVILRFVINDTKNVYKTVSC